MAKKRVRRIDYADLRALVEPYHKFSFRNKKHFIPQQKSAITRVYNSLLPFLKKIADNRISFIPLDKKIKKKDLPDIDYWQTNKGIFYKFPGAKLRRMDDGTLKITIHFGKRREVFIPIPQEILGNIELMQIYVDGKEREYKPKPDYIRWSINGYAGSTFWDPKRFDLYMTEELPEKTDAKNRDLSGLFNGVFFGWNPRRRNIVWLGERKELR